MIKAKKSLGQNFLIDQNIIKKIVKTVFVKNNNIFEIGAGTGNLSKEILGAMFCHLWRGKEEWL